MSKRLDIMAPRKSRDGKTFWTRIGTAWEGDKGVQLVFDALPIPDSEGRVVANLFEPRERSDAPRNQTAGERTPAYQDDGDAPF
jgi:hypothetical protein